MQQSFAVAKLARWHHDAVAGHINSVLWFPFCFLTLYLQMKMRTWKICTNSNGLSVNKFQYGLESSSARQWQHLSDLLQYLWAVLGIYNCPKRVLNGIKNPQECTRLGRIPSTTDVFTFSVGYDCELCKNDRCKKSFFYVFFFLVTFFLTFLTFFIFQTFFV